MIVPVNIWLLHQSLESVFVFAILTFGLCSVSTECWCGKYKYSGPLVRQRTRKEPHQNQTAPKGGFASSLLGVPLWQSTPSCGWNLCHMWIWSERLGMQGRFILRSINKYNWPDINSYFCLSLLSDHWAHWKVISFINARGRQISSAQLTFLLISALCKKRPLRIGGESMCVLFGGLNEYC